MSVTHQNPGLWSAVVSDDGVYDMLRLPPYNEGILRIPVLFTGEDETEGMHIQTSSMHMNFVTIHTNIASHAAPLTYWASTFRRHVLHFRG